MPLDVDKISQGAARLAGEAANAVNDIAKSAGPTVERVSEHVDALAEKGRPYVERAEKEVKDFVDDALGRNTNAK